MCGTEKGAQIKIREKNYKTYVIVDVGSVRNAPHEIRFSSLDLQGHNLNLNRVNKNELVVKLLHKRLKFSRQYH
jgi:hypothetical protein